MPALIVDSSQPTFSVDFQGSFLVKQFLCISVVNSLPVHIYNNSKLISTEKLQCILKSKLV